MLANVLGVFEETITSWHSLGMYNESVSRFEMRCCRCCAMYIQSLDVLGRS